MDRQQVVVIGAGMGGLAAAMELAAGGCDVTLCERAAAPGGKVRQVDAGGAAIDAGPTVFTMRWVFEELFERCGLPWPPELVLQPVEVLARHAWLEGGRLDLFADPERSADAVGGLCGAAEARRFLAFTERARRLYAALEGSFIRAARPSPLSVARGAGAGAVPAIARAAFQGTLWRALGEHFHDRRLRQLFGRYATYCGSSPFAAPATLMLIAHVEQDGVWLVRDGMVRLADALAAGARALGVTLRCATGVDEILVSRGRVSGVRLAGGETVDARAVVCNGDVSALGAGCFGAAVRGAAPATPRARRSLSALTWALSARTDGFALSRHNVFFSDDYAAEFADVFTSSRVPATPTVYVCAQDRGGAAAAADADGGTAAPERLLCLVNAPAGGDRGGLHAHEIEVCEHRAFEVLERCGLTVHRRPEATVTTAPQDFEALFPATGGALYGAACHGWRASFTRPGARTRVPGLYLAGGSVHPGPGVPMATLSGHHAAACVLQDLRA